MDKSEREQERERNTERERESNRERGKREREREREQGERDREGEAVLGLSHLVLTLLHRSIDVKYHFVSIVVVVDSVSMVVIREGVRCIDGEGGCGGGGSGGGRRLRSGSGDILLGGLPLCWNRLTVVGMVA